MVNDLGFVRFQAGDALYSVADTNLDIPYAGDGYIIIDRLVLKSSAEEKYQFETRLKDSLTLAFLKGE